MDTELPRVVALVGPAGAGKTTLSEAWLRLFPQHVHVDDLAPLLEFLTLDRVVAEATSPDSLRTRLIALKRDLRFLPDLAADYLAEVEGAPGRLPRPRYCRPIESGGMEIANPAVWDDIMVRLGRTLVEGAAYLVEFARGHDPAYIGAFGLDKEQVYERTFHIFRSSLAATLAASMVVLHVCASHETRLYRNERRAKVTGQFTPPKVMNNVFRTDVLRPSYVSSGPNGLGLGYTTVKGERIALATVFNDSEKAQAERTRFFDRACSTAMEYFRGAVPDGVSRG